MLERVAPMPSDPDVAEGTEPVFRALRSLPFSQFLSVSA
jgi:hypothetical protein